MKQIVSHGEKILIKTKSSYVPPCMSIIEVKLSGMLAVSNERFETDPEFEM